MECPHLGASARLIRSLRERSLEEDQKVIKSLQLATIFDPNTATQESVNVESHESILLNHFKHKIDVEETKRDFRKWRKMMKHRLDPIVQAGRQPSLLDVASIRLLRMRRQLTCSLE